MNTKSKNIKNTAKKVSILFLVVLLALVIFSNKPDLNVLAIPQGATITLNQTENASVRQADSHTAAGGSFTTLVLNVTSQTSKWKAYVGNVTGKMTLDNANNYTIYDWILTTTQGEVYISRNDSINFSAVACANDGNISAEETFLNINSSSDDSITNTFNETIHRSFVIGGTGTISNSTCYAIATYVNDAAQAADENADFQEVLLSDGTNLVFTALLEDDQQGFDLGNYDFQLIAPDDPGSTSTTYYFYAELG